MRKAAPLRFLALVVGGWVCLRVAILAPGWSPETAPAAGTAALSRDAVPQRPIAGLPPPAPVAVAGRATRPPAVPAIAAPVAVPARPALPPIPPSLPPATRGDPRPARGAPPPVLEPTAAPAQVRSEGRWTGSAWILLRRAGDGGALAPGGILGGSQAGTRLLYRIGGGGARPLALSARIYAPLPRIAGAEAALGLDWRPSARLPIHLLAERRQALGGEGRSAFSLALYGGLERDLPFGLRLDAYGQAGLVGLRARDPFVDGSARIAARLGPVELGGAAWGAAQPGASRLDAGPHISYRLPVRGANLRLSADWRFRLAGDAAPGSGPAVVLAAGF